MHSAITNILCELLFHGVDLPLPCPIPAYWMRHPDHLDFMCHPDQFGNGYTSDGGFIGEATESWGRGPYASSHSMVSTSPYSRMSFIALARVNMTSTCQSKEHSRSDARTARSSMMFLLETPFFERLALSSERANIQSRGVLHTFQQEMKKKIAPKNFAKSELPFWDAGVECPNWETATKLWSERGA
ncbi:hypothetical protein B0H16DRAFT_1478351 [Mycena metata]|uniref:Uncharacterized protein n=1 Tax=Mycena metata TaxID=1033252 RepID=A0AAD7H6U6_9AGAR|nr:hypothetical protein B0H16DRAFT_1478351 [Mycena metata]